MTNEEAIKILEKQFSKSCRGTYQNAEKLDFEDALCIAIAAIRAQAELNAPKS